MDNDARQRVRDEAAREAEALKARDARWAASAKEGQALLRERERELSRHGMHEVVGADGEKRIVKSKCFVATAVYGDPEMEQVNILREYRDTVLAQSLAGRCFIRAYYGGLGAIAALLITSLFPWSKPIIRRRIDAFVDARRKKL